MTEPDYRPASRRPIADGFRLTAKTAVAACVRWNVSPDAISYLSMVAAAGAALCFWLSPRAPLLLLILGPLLCYVRLWMNMLDGMVAIASGKASSRGEILNDLPDRVSDVIIFVGVAHSGWGSPFPAYWAAIFALMTAYVGTFGQAVGGRRQFGGLMSKPWRMVTLHLGTWTLLATILTGHANLKFVGLTVLDWTCLVVVGGCIQTIVVRLKAIMRSLNASSP